MAHDAKSLGGRGRHGLLATAGAGALEIDHDTMIGAYLVDPARRTYVLEELAADAGIAVRSAGQAEPSSDGQLELGEEPAPATRRHRPPVVGARQRQREQLDEFGLERVMREVELPLVDILVAMENEGLGLDQKRLAAIGEGMEERIAELESQIYEGAGREFTIGSPQQLGEVLFVELGLSRKRRGKTGFSTDARVLSQIRDEHPIVPAVEQWRELTKLKNTYLDTLPGLLDPETGRIHTAFNQVTAATGRLSSTNPNLQNIPIRSEVGRRSAPASSPTRATACSRPTTTRSSSVFWRTSPTRTCCAEIFASGEDVHSATAAGIIGADPDAITPGERSKAKMVNYGIAYGLTDFGLAHRLQISRGGGAALHRALLRALPRDTDVHRRDDRQGGGRGLRHHADGPAATDPGAALEPAPAPLAGRAPGGQHRDPGNRSRHHQAGDGPLPPRADRGGRGPA